MAKVDRAGALLDLLFDFKATGDRHKITIERYDGGFRASSGSSVGRKGSSPTDALDNLRREVLDATSARIGRVSDRLRLRRAEIDQLRERREALRA